MASYAIDFDARARKDLSALSPDLAVRIARRLRELVEDPYPRGDTIRRLQGFAIPTYRFRVGDHRAVYQIFGERVALLRILHRSQLDRTLRLLR